MSDYHDVVCDFQLAFEPAVKVSDDKYAGIVAKELGFEEANIEIDNVYHYQPTRHGDTVGPRGATEIQGTYNVG